jgi:hypothetical protein
MKHHKKYRCNGYRHQIGCPHRRQKKVPLTVGGKVVKMLDMMKKTADEWDVIDTDTPLKEKYPRTHSLAQKILEISRFPRI